MDTRYVPTLQQPTTRDQSYPHQLRVLLLGSTGFIGNRILRALQVRDDIAVSILTRQPTTPLLRDGNKYFTGDIADPLALTQAMEDAEIVINAASYIGRDLESAERTNVQGTANVIQACNRLGIRRLVQISTTAVYGTGPHRGQSPDTLDYAPQSVTSCTRALGDKAVLSAGGIVIRPALVYGAGDRWFLPGLIRMFSILRSTVNYGLAQQSVIEVTDLGRLVAELATNDLAPARAYHAVNPKPIGVKDLLSATMKNVTPIPLSGSCSTEVAIELLGSHGFSPHQVNMLSLDHYYDAGAIWDIAGFQPRRLALDLPATRDWYTGNLANV